jgi:hypothetical protein
VNQFLRDRIMRRLEALPEERAYQVLDYVEFLESKYAARAATTPNVVQKFAEGVQDTLRAGNVSAQAISETMGYMSKAMGILAGAKAAAESVASDVSGVVKKAVDRAGSTGDKARSPEKPEGVPEPPPPTAGSTDPGKGTAGGA